ncbi:hypothetical protein AX774_g5373 [Zancudomyces culisetae]|uniref:Uncharacterized protein n=1 Tax=Zancudomyces culisetae TaxID=1213189 RepID=A0A1R1PJN1_ZANCU|nr:hypothetical protein AX774_g5373 [Zancudomyces culisetae]|eukprot:OMH81176.1 hypothetical protein AX774_g5373 [Zancudomyces culisetae]
MDNIGLLSRGQQVYTKKRKAKKDQIESIEFDPASRAKRKLAKKETKIQSAKLREKKEIQEFRKQVRVCIDIPISVYPEIDSENDEPKRKIRVLESENSKTTVTVIENLDLDNPLLYDDFSYQNENEDKKSGNTKTVEPSRKKSKLEKLITPQAFLKKQLREAKSSVGKFDSESHSGNTASASKTSKKSKKK